MGNRWVRKKKREWRRQSVDAPSCDVPSLSVLLPKSRQRMSRRHAVTSWRRTMTSRDVMTSYRDVMWCHDVIVGGFQQWSGGGWRHVMSRHDFTRHHVMWRYIMTSRDVTSWRHVTSCGNIRQVYDDTWRHLMMPHDVMWHHMTWCRPPPPPNHCWKCTYGIQEVVSFQDVFEFWKSDTYWGRYDQKCLIVSDFHCKLSEPGWTD